MTTVDELQQRLATLESIVSHLSTHHDEKLFMIEDSDTAESCDQLFTMRTPSKSARKQKKARLTTKR